MVDGLFKMIARGRSGIYLDGKKLRFGRYVIIGSPVFFWFKSAYRAKHFVTAGVLARGWEMFAAAGARKAVTSISGRKSPPILPLTPRIMGNLPWKIPRRVQNYSAPWHTLDTLDPTGIANIPPDLPAAGEFRTK